MTAPTPKPPLAKDQLGALALPLALDQMGYIVDAQGRDVAYDKAALAAMLDMVNRCAEVEQHARAMAAALREVAKRPQQGYTSKGAFAIRLVSVQSIARAALAAWDAAEKGGEGRQ
jgi:hypothetical protein